MRIQKIGERPTPRPHQEECLSKFWDSDTMALFVGTRMGKSLMTIWWTTHRIAVNEITDPRILFIAPKTPLIDFTEELKRMGQDFSLAFGGRDRRIEILEDENNWKLINYEALCVTPEIQDLHWDAVIWDESVSIANHRNRVTKFSLNLCQKVRIRAILSAIPAPEDYAQIWSQMAVKNGGVWMGKANFWNWKNELGYDDPCGYGWIWKKGSFERVKSCVHDEAVFMTREDKGLGKKQKRKRVWVRITDQAKELYRNAEKYWEVPKSNGGLLEAKNHLTTYTWMRRILGGFVSDIEVESRKYEKLLMLMKRHQSEQFVIWFAFKKELFKVKKFLEERGYRCAEMYGEMKRADRKRGIQEFRKGRKDCMLSIETVGRYGLDLSCSNVVIYFSCGYSFNTRSQNKDRTEHMDKEMATVVYDLVTKGTIEEDIQMAIKEKGISVHQLARKALL